MKTTTATIFTCLAVISTFISSPAFADIYECTFKEGHIAKPTPTRVVIEIDNHRSEGKLLEIDIPGVLTQPGPVRILRNNINVASVEWDGRSYEFTPEAVQKGARVGGVIDRMDWYTYRFSVFLNKKNQKSSTRSRDPRRKNRSFEKPGTCVRLQ